MHALTEAAVRSSFVNASRREVKEMTLPDGIDEWTEETWAELDMLGWRDPRYARRGYVVAPSLDGDPVGIALTQSTAAPRSRAMCNWCRDVRLPNEVVLFGARRTGKAGRQGASVGILLCSGFQCCRNVRNDPPPAYDGFDVAAARERRIDDLRLRVAGFAADVSSDG